ncbi:hypothetical protein F9802_18335 [Bacillus aerolatus]|uniref:Uncharacterized protein n=1 Tax=Bacillus aerolatus TaxID=2653354 RepID=A0A6I1FB21_9BACI|nr:hypothetical protein [Bacillus aerolatus]KAB7704246.1 hypothetical protein F9802_18335 [Bacillus aerolatus]
MTLAEYNQRYETILHGNFSNGDKAKMLASLMTELEQEFEIPTLRNEAWEAENKAVIALYKKVSMSRTL